MWPQSAVSESQVSQFSFTIVCNYFVFNGFNPMWVLYKINIDMWCEQKNVNDHIEIWYAVQNNNLLFVCHYFILFSILFIERSLQNREAWKTTLKIKSPSILIFFAYVIPGQILINLCVFYLEAKTIITKKILEKRRIMGSIFKLISEL